MIMVIAFFPYQWILSIGAIRAVIRYIQRTSNWEKTVHVGQHRRDALHHRA
jgi:glycosyltransferase XagB